VELHYSSFEDITRDIDDARIYGGIHYRFDQEEGGRQGRHLGDYVYRHNLRPKHHRCEDDVEGRMESDPSAALTDLERVPLPASR
jgi:hypothetical protein